MRNLLVALIVVVGFGGSAMAQSKVAHVNTQALLDTMPSRIAAIKQYEEYEKSIYMEMQELEATYQKAVRDLEAKYGDLTPTMQQYEEQKLNELMQRIQIKQQTAQEQLVKVSNELNAPILERVKKAVEIVAERKKLSYVVDITNMLYSAGGMDITNEVITELMKLEAADTPQ